MINNLNKLGMFVCLFGLWTDISSINDSPECLSTYRKTWVGLTGARLKGKQGQEINFWFKQDIEFHGQIIKDKYKD